MNDRFEILFPLMCIYLMTWLLIENFNYKMLPVYFMFITVMINIIYKIWKGI